MDAFRKQLDALMGANRNGDTNEVKHNYWDRDVCRPHLTGLCPQELFSLTKMDMGVCPNIHSLQLRKEYEEAVSSGKANYDREVEQVLERHIVECDRKIQRSLRRLEDEKSEAATAIAVSEVTKSEESDKISKEITDKLKQIDECELQGNMDDKVRLSEEIEVLNRKRAEIQAQLIMVAFAKEASKDKAAGATAPVLPAYEPDAKTQEKIREKIKLAEELGEKGMIDEAQKLMEEADNLKKRPESLQNLLPSTMDQKLRVCDICGAFLSIYDSDRRLADHFGGKLHLGYIQIREKLQVIRKRKLSEVKKFDDRRERSSERAVVREVSRDHYSERGRDSRRARDTDRPRSRSRDRERDFSDRGRHHDRDRRRDSDDRKRRDRY